MEHNVNAALLAVATRHSLLPVSAVHTARSRYSLKLLKFHIYARVLNMHVFPWAALSLASIARCDMVLIQEERRRCNDALDHLSRSTLLLQ